MARRDPKVNATLGRVLRARREAAGMSQMALSEASGLSSVHISNLERGKSAPSIAALWALAKALGTTPSEILRAVEAQLR